MNKEEIEKYKIRNHYMIPVEIVDNIFYTFEQENKQLKEQLNLAENILYDYLYKDGKITKELYFKIKDYKELNGLKN